MNVVQKINETLLKIKKFKDSVKKLPDGNLNRLEYKNKYHLEDGFNFILTAKDIIKNKIPFQVIGCTGLAKLFVYYSQEIGLGCDIIFMANKDDLENKRKIINGHQLISVKLENTDEIIFDPQNSYLKKIELNNYIHNNALHIFTGRLSGKYIEQVNSYKILEDIYTNSDTMNQGIENLNKINIPVISNRFKERF